MSNIQVGTTPTSVRMEKFSTALTIFEGIDGMSAITETEPGQEMVCILGFEVRPKNDGGGQNLGAYRSFSVGEYVKYISHFFVRTPEDNPIGYMAVFQPIDSSDDNKYEATQDYFVTLDCWEALKEYFVSNLIVTEIGKPREKKKHTYKLTQVKADSARKTTNKNREI